MVINALKENGLSDNTIIIATTDHGVAVPGHKCNLSDFGTGIFLIISGPGFNGGLVSDHLVSQLDIFPTLCDAASIAPARLAQGQSLHGLGENPDQSHHDYIFSEVTYHAAYQPMRMVRDERYGLIVRYGDKRTPVLANVDESPCRDSWLANHWAEQEYADIGLYDTFFDPSWGVNLSESAEHRDILQRLQSELQSWQERTDDPILQGPVPPRSGAKYNTQDDFLATGLPQLLSK